MMIGGRFAGLLLEKWVKEVGDGILGDFWCESLWEGVICMRLCRRFALFEGFYFVKSWFLEFCSSIFWSIFVVIWILLKSKRINWPSHLA